jgi:hypothetical protein
MRFALHMSRAKIASGFLSQDAQNLAPRIAVAKVPEFER